MTTYRNFESSNIAGFGHIGQGRVWVEFKRQDGSTTRYLGAVPAYLYASWTRARSKGRFFSRHIRPLGVMQRQEAHGA